MHMESASRELSRADALYGPGGSENTILRKESQEVIAIVRISEHVARRDDGPGHSKPSKST